MSDAARFVNIVGAKAAVAQGIVSTTATGYVAKATGFVFSRPSRIQMSFGQFCAASTTDSSAPTSSSRSNSGSTVCVKPENDGELSRAARLARLEHLKARH